MTDRATTPGVRIVSLAGVGESVAAALASDGRPGRPIVVVGCPGDAAEEVLLAVRQAAADAAAGSTVLTVLRSDRHDGVAFSRRNDLEAACQGAVVVPDAQWLHEEALGRIIDLAVDSATDQALIAIHRHGVDRAALTELRQLARRSNRLLDVRLESAETLVGSGVDEAEAERLIAATGGSPILLDLVDDDVGFDTEVVARLSTVDETARRAAELIAFGLDADLLAAFGVIGSGAHLDEALTQLRLEGVVIGAAIPTRVARAVRSACPPGRRSELVNVVVGHGPAGAEHDLAAVLFAEGDRSTAAGRLYATAAAATAADEPKRATEFATAALESGIERSAVAVTMAIAHLGSGDPSAAIETLEATDDPDAAIVSAAAWTALGDLVAASEAAARSSDPPLARWSETGIGAAADDAHAADRTADVGSEAARRLAALVNRWWRPSDTPDQHDDVLDDLLDDVARTAIRARADRTADRWPIAPELVGVQIAARDGDFATAGRLAARADVSAVHAGTRLALLAWVEARRGHLDAADDALAELEERRCSPHDRLIAAGARCAAAVRESDGARLDDAVAAAQAALDTLPPHLHVLDPVADVAGAASRSRVDVGDVLARCERYARRDPEGRGTADVARARLVAALAGDDLDAIGAAARAVLDLPPRMSGRWRSAAEILAAPADADAADVIEVARGLAESEASYEAARLCGVVALATTDADASRKLLKESRVWRATRRQVAAAPGVDRSVVGLSEQEERVGRLVLDGYTHKQVGAELFISPKTVEHHVAHIRTKLGCANRAEMLTTLRDYLV